jgi:hypothetical protein
MTGFETNSPGGDGPRPESPGEASVRLADWFMILFRLFGIRPYPYEVEGLAKFCGALIRRWPRLGQWKAPAK